MKRNSSTRQLPEEFTALDVEKQLDQFLSKTNVPERLTVSDIKDIVWNENEHNLISRLAFYFYDHVPENRFQEVLDIMQKAWNYFPHKSLNGFSPHDLVNRSKSGMEREDLQHRKDFYEVFEKRFPDKVRLVKKGEDVWEFEHPVMMQRMRSTIQHLKEAMEVMEDQEDESEDEVGDELMMRMEDSIEDFVKQEPLFFEGATFIARDLWSYGEVEEAYVVLENSVIEGRKLFPSDFVPSKHTLPWGMIDNRPYLFLLGEYATFTESIRGTLKAIPLYEELIDLNPNDNTGIRGHLATAYLKTNMPERLCELSDKFKDDLLPELVVGRLLALYKLEKKDEFKDGVVKLLKYCKHIFEEILKTSHTQPELTPGRVSVGGEDEAWLYWQEQGNIWMTTPGARELLRESLG